MRGICQAVHFLAIIAYCYALKAEYACQGPSNKGMFISIYNELDENFKHAAAKSQASNTQCVATGNGTSTDKFILDLKMDNNGVNELAECGMTGDGTTASPGNLTVVVQHNSAILQAADVEFVISCDFSIPRTQQINLEGTKAREPCTADQFYCSITSTCVDRLFRCNGTNECFTTGPETGCNQNATTGLYNIEKSTGNEKFLEYRGFGYRLKESLAVIEDVVAPDIRATYDNERNNYENLGQSDCIYTENNRYKDWFNKDKPTGQSATCDFLVGMEKMLNNSCDNLRARNAADENDYFRDIAGCDTSGSMGLSANIAVLAILMMVLALF